MQACAWTGDCKLADCAEKCVIDTDIGDQAITEMFSKKLMDAIACPLMSVVLTEVVNSGGVGRRLQVCIFQLGVLCFV